MVFKLREIGMAGVTVTRGIEGFGHCSGCQRG
ncbi:MAG: DUF190 domain-containing protein [Peptostreptococcaceae bacterium]|nr:DUF190 domain-containing protein [Peptostreptococcaceae bacterium]